MTEITAKPFDWNDNLSKEAIEDFEGIQKDLPYCTCQNIGMALAKLELLEKQGQEVKTDRIVPIILIDKKGEEHDGLMDMRRMLIYLHNIPAETAISLGYTWKSAEGSDTE